MCQRGGNVGDIGKWGQWGFNQVIIFLLKAFDLTKLRDKGQPLDFLGTWGLGIFTSEMGKGEG